MIIWKYFSCITKKLPINNGSYLRPMNRCGNNIVFCISGFLLFIYDFSRWFTKTSHQNIQNRFNMNEKRLKTKDSIAETYKLIYKAPMESYISFTKHMSSFTCITIAGLYIYEYYAINYKNMKVIDKDTSIGLHSTKLSTKDGDMNKFAVGFLIINTVVFMFSGRYALRIYKLNKR